MPGSADPIASWWRGVYQHNLDLAPGPLARLNIRCAAASVEHAPQRFSVPGRFFHDAIDLGLPLGSRPSTNPLRKPTFSAYLAHHHGIVKLVPGGSGLQHNVGFLVNTDISHETHLVNRRDSPPRAVAPKTLGWWKSAGIPFWAIWRRLRGNRSLPLLGSESAASHKLSRTCRL